MPAPALIIMAAGIGSRFGGLKQVEPVGPNGELVIEYSIYDALQAGFEKVVFLIREEMLDLFREKVGKRVEGSIQTAMPSSV
jgi:CTP:molybdopterin cytidylyltransferase MocA